MDVVPVEATVRTLVGTPPVDRVVLILLTAATDATVFLGATEKIVMIVVMVSVRIVALTVMSAVISAEDVVLIAISVLLSMVIVARAVSVLAASIAILVIRAVSLEIVVMVSVRIVV